MALGGATEGARSLALVVTPQEEGVQGLERKAGGVRVGGLDRLHRAGRAKRGCWMAQGGLVVGGSPPPGVGCVGVGGQEVVPAVEEKATAFRLVPLAPLPLLRFYQGTKEHAMLDLVLKKHKQPQKTSQTARGLALEKNNEWVG